MPPLRRYYANVLIGVGLLILLYPILTEVYGDYVQSQLNRQWERQAYRQAREAKLAERRQLAALGRRTFQSENAVFSESVAPLERAEKELAAQPFPPTKIIIPKLGVEQVVLDGMTEDVIKNGPGHYPGTANPGRKGNVAIAGHRVTYTHPFNRIDELVAGDVVLLETLDYTYEYRVVTNKTLDPSDLSMLQPTPDARLTLTTCTPKYSARYRLDVQATLAKATPRQRPTILRQIVTRVIRAPEPGPLPKNVFDLAIQDAREELAAKPVSAMAHTRLGIIYQNLGRHAQAQKEFEVAISLDPRLAIVHYQLALLYRRLGEIDKSGKELETAVSLDPDFEPAYFRLGSIYLEMRDYPRAVDALERSVNLSPLSADSHYYLGVAYEKTGNKDRAVQEYLGALRFVPDYREARAALKSLIK